MGGANSGQVVLGYKKAGWASHREHVSQQHSFMASPPAPASRFLPWVPVLTSFMMDCDQDEWAHALTLPAQAGSGHISSKSCSQGLNSASCSRFWGNSTSVLLCQHNLFLSRSHILQTASASSGGLVGTQKAGTQYWEARPGLSALRRRMGLDPSMSLMVERKARWLVGQLLISNEHKIVS